VPDVLSYFAVLALVALASARRGRIARWALRWLAGHALRAGRDGSLRARAARSARRASGTAAAAAALWGTAEAPAVTLPVLAVLASGGAGFGAYRARAWQRRRSHHRRWVRPAYMAAQGIAGWPEDAHPSKWLTVAPDRSAVTARLPVGWKAETSEQARLSQVLAVRLGIESPVVRYQLAGHAPRLELSQAPPPPGKTVFADARAVMEHAGPDELVWGRGKRGAWVTTSLSGDSPHIGISMGSGAGKSVTARLLLAQVLHKGGIGLIPDIKMLSHMWALGLPNVAVAVRIPEIHNALVWLGTEIARRNEVAFASADINGTVRADFGPRIIVVAEELNAAMPELRKYWAAIRGRDDPVRSPALDALDAASFMGRQVKINVLYIGQALSARAMGGGRDSTENLGVIAMRWTTPRTWKMLAPDHAQPPRSTVPGLIHVVSHEVRECRAVLVTETEAREYALSGAVSPLPAGMPGAPVQAGGAGLEIAETGAVVQGEIVSELAKKQVRPVSPQVPVSSLVTLREAAVAGVLGRLGVAGARTARHRDPRFPAPAGRDGITDLYELQALADYASARGVS
jgi:hypothetical protein